jgi:hypothetical protein
MRVPRFGCGGLTLAASLSLAVPIWRFAVKGEELLVGWGEWRPIDHALFGLINGGTHRS